MRAEIRGVCVTGKVRFPDADQAAIALVAAQEKRARQGASLERTEKRYYECPMCRGGYHLTSKTLEQMRSDDAHDHPWDDPRVAGTG